MSHNESNVGWGRRLRLVRRGDRVVVIDTDPDNEHIGACREMGVPVLAGDVTDEEILETVNLSRARHVVAVTGDDGTNLKIAVHTYALVTRKRRPYLVAWEELTEDIKEYDREAVRNIPRLLGLVGKKVVRTMRDLQKNPLSV